MKKSLLLLSFFTLSLLAGCSDTQQTTLSSNWFDDCYDSVKSEIKSPSSAIFTKEDEIEWLVHVFYKWYVESQNSFWAMVKSNFVCMVWKEDWVWLSYMEWWSKISETMYKEINNIIFYDTSTDIFEKEQKLLEVMVSATK